MKTTIFHRYREAVRRLLPAVAVVSLVLALGAFGMVKRLGPEYEVHFSYIISLSEREASGDYKFDGYYALQSTDLFTATVAAWAASPETVVAAYNEAGVLIPGSDARVVGRVVRAEKTAPQLVHVTVKHKNDDVARRLASGLQTVMQSNIEDYHEQGMPALKFRAITTPIWTGKSEMGAGVVATATFLAVFIIGLNGVLLLESFRELERSVEAS